MSIISTLFISFIQLWDLDDLLEGSGKTITSQAATADSDSDEMDAEINSPKINKGIPGLLQNCM
jgi:hypothetical protein